MSLIFPPALQKGDKIALLSTARKISADALAPIMQVFSECGLNVVQGKTLGLEHHPFAGTEKERLEDLQWALDDAEIKAVFCVGGGYGTVQIIDRFDFTSFAQHPKALGAGIEPDAHGRVSARLHGPERPGVLYLDKPWRAPIEGYAIEFWFMPDTVELMALGSLTTTEYKRPHISLIEIGGRRPGDSAGVGSLRYLLRWPPGHRDGMNLYSVAAMALP